MSGSSVASTSMTWMSAQKWSAWALPGSIVSTLRIRICISWRMKARSAILRPRLRQSHFINLGKHVLTYWLCSSIAWRCLSAPLWITCSTSFAFSSALAWSLKTCSLLDCSGVAVSSPLEQPPIKRNGMNNIHRYFFVIMVSCAVMGWGFDLKLFD